MTTRQPVAGPRGDARAVIAASSAQRGHLILAHAAARWASGGLADALAGVASPAEAIRIAQRLAD